MPINQLLDEINSNSTSQVTLLPKQFNPLEISQIFDAMKGNISVESFILAGNMMGKNIANKTGELLLTNSTLKVIDISATGITAKDAYALAKGLRENTSLEQFICTDNALMDSGIELLAHAAVHHPSLTALHLANSGAGDMGAKALAEMLEENPTILELTIKNSKNCGISPKILREIEENLKDNGTDGPRSGLPDFSSFTSGRTQGMGSERHVR